LRHIIEQNQHKLIYIQYDLIPETFPPKKREKMSKLVLFNLMTVDGFFEGPNREIDWHNVDAEFNEFAIEQLDEAGMLIFGRITYELMAGFWPKPEALEDDPVVARKMNSLPKSVFSKTLDKVEWANTTLITSNIEKYIIQMKRDLTKDIFLFGSSELASELRRLNLIDEYRILINPILLGNGKPLFKAGDRRLNLSLMWIREFRSGNILLCYSPK
jgi:dihydrofolate reductase